MKHRIFLSLAAILALSFPLLAQPTIPENDAAPNLGLGLTEALARFGPPTTVFAVRGAESWQDDVVFSYASGFSLFWFGDRLWQIRFAAPYSGSVYGLSIGDPVEKAYSLLGEPHEAPGGEFVYRLPYQGYPVRLRLVVKEGRLADAYLYRADF
ncbi:MAG: hypothetical protein Q8M76_19580 [Spirochaetaceae bacterium]|nr:hypothetical protein [Spirochaetaceae bacterium]